MSIIPKSHSQCNCVITYCDPWHGLMQKNIFSKVSLSSEVHLGIFVKCAAIIPGHKPQQQGLRSTDFEDRKDIS